MLVIHPVENDAIYDLGKKNSEISFCEILYYVLWIYNLCVKFVYFASNSLRSNSVPFFVRGTIKI